MNVHTILAIAALLAAALQTTGGTVLPPEEVLAEAKIYYAWLVGGPYGEEAKPDGDK
jgi:hypothetical protein